MAATTLHELRKAKGVSLRQVHADIGIFPAHLSEMERGVREASAAWLAALSEYYGVSLEGWRKLYVHTGES